MKMLNKIIAFLIVLSILLFPNVKLGEGFPSVQFVDFLLPIIGFIVFKNWYKVVWRKFFTIILVFGAYIILSIVVNSRITSVKDYFEIFKLIKFLLIVLFFSIVEINNYKKNIFYPIFGLLVLFNLFHYFNLFGVNYLIEHYYNGGVHIELFGLDSLGAVSTKRMIGAIGNPNTNAIIFLFFTSIFYPEKKKFSFELIVFFVALFLFFLCQSRTGFIALFLMIIFDVINKLFILKTFNKWSMIPIVLVVIAYSFSYLFSSNIIETERYVSNRKFEQIPKESKTLNKHTYINSIFSGEIAKTGSVKGRVEIWKHLFSMVKKKPIFGHGPDKDYFYDNKLYAENEYILYLWRYGVIGLLFYILFYVYLFYKGITFLRLTQGVLLSFLAIILIITALTNAPLSSREILVFLAVLIGLLFNSSNLIQDGKS